MTHAELSNDGHCMSWIVLCFILVFPFILKGENITIALESQHNVFPFFSTLTYSSNSSWGISDY